MTESCSIPGPLVLRIFFSQRSLDRNDWSLITKRDEYIDIYISSGLQRHLQQNLKFMRDSFQCQAGHNLSCILKKCSLKSRRREGKREWEVERRQLESHKYAAKMYSTITKPNKPFQHALWGTLGLYNIKHGASAGLWLHCTSTFASLTAVVLVYSIIFHLYGCSRGPYYQDLEAHLFFWLQKEKAKTMRASMQLFRYCFMPRDLQQLHVARIPAPCMIRHWADIKVSCELRSTDTTNILKCTFT